MKSLSLFPKSIFLILLVAFISHPAYAKKMYKWVDEDGKTYFSDKVPTEHKDFKRESLDKDARVIETTEKTKSKTEVAMEKNLNQIKLQQKKLLSEQDKYDKFLLSTFPSDRDMKRSHRTKLKALSDDQEASEEKVVSLKEKLKDLQSQAGKFDEKNQKVPEEHLKEIEDTQKAIEKAKVDIEKYIIKTKQTEKKFAADLVRYQLLSRSKKSALSEENELKSEKKKAKNKLGLFTCSDKEQCKKAWKLTLKYIKSHSSTAILINSDKLIISEKSNKAISLSASKMTSKKKKLKIFLDVHCTSDEKDKSLCLTPKAQELRNEFSPFIRKNLGLVADDTTDETEN